MWRDFQIQQHEQKRNNDPSLSYNNSNHIGKRSPVENDKIQIVGTKPSINYKFSTIGREIFVPHAGQ